MSITREELYKPRLNLRQRMKNGCNPTLPDFTLEQKKELDNTLHPEIDDNEPYYEVNVSSCKNWKGNSYIDFKVGEYFYYDHHYTHRTFYSSPEYSPHNFFGDPCYGIITDYDEENKVVTICRNNRYQSRCLDGKLKEE